MPCTTICDARHSTGPTTDRLQSGVNEQTGHQQGAGGVGPDLREREKRGVPRVYRAART